MEAESGIINPGELTRGSDGLATTSPDRNTKKDKPVDDNTAADVNPRKVGEPASNPGPSVLNVASEPKVLIKTATKDTPKSKKEKSLKDKKQPSKPTVKTWLYPMMEPF